jgi:hypothetical protein
MTTVKKFFALGIFMLISVLAYAQKVTVSGNAERVNGKNYDGYSTELTGSLEEVNTALTKYLKTFGKVKATGNQFQVSEAQVNLNQIRKSLLRFFQSKRQQCNGLDGCQRGERLG